MGSRRQVALAVACFAVGLYVSACASRSIRPEISEGLSVNSPPTHETIPEAVAHDLPALPKDSYVSPAAILARRTAAIGEISFNGSEPLSFDQNSVSPDPDDESLLLDAEEGSLSWAMYCFRELVAEDAPLLAKLRLQGDTPSCPCYIGIADYSTGSWTWATTETSQPVYNIPVTSDAISPAGNLYVLIAVFDSASLQVREAALQLDTPLPPPDGFHVISGDGDQVPALLEWVDPAVSFDPDGAGPGSFDYTGVRIDVSDGPAGPWSTITTVPAGSGSSFTDPATLAQQPGATPPRYYQLHTMNINLSGLGGIVRRSMPEFAINQVVARITITPAAPATAPATVTLSGTGSTISGGTLKSVQWDTDGNGTWDKTTTPTLTTTATLPTQGAYYLRLKLTMDIGGGSILSDTVTGFVTAGDYRGDWNQQGRSSGHDHLSHVAAPASASLRGTYSGSSRFFEPVVNNVGNIYALSSDNVLHILKPDLTPFMDVSLGYQPTAGGALTTTGHYWIPVTYGLFQYKLICVLPNFTVKEYQTFGPITGSPVTAPSGFMTYFAANDKLYAAYPTPSPGIKTWYDWVYVPAKDCSINQPGVDRSGNIYFGVSSISGGPFLYSLDRNGKFRWRKAVPGLPSAPSVGPEGYIYTVIVGNLYSFDHLGNNRWAYGGAGDMLSAAPAISPEGNVVVASSLGKICMVTPGGWDAYPPQQVVGRTYTCQPSIDENGRMYLIATDGKMYALTKKGIASWNYPLAGSALGGGIAISQNGNLLCGGTSKLTALK